MHTDLTQGQLREVLHYDPETGWFTWLKKTSTKVVVGRRAGQLARNGYRQIGILGTRYMEHRLAVLYMTGEWPEFEVDHEKGVRDDNRYAKLRVCTHAENGQNRSKPSHGKSRLQGVTWHKLRQKWRASVALHGVQKHLGLFDDEAAAHQAYLSAKADLHKFQPTPRTP